MEQIGRSWSGMSLQQRVIVVVATVGVFLGIIFLTRQAAQPRMDLL